jgi:hypothetical protein
LLLQRAHEELAWPPPEAIFSPRGVGPAVEVATVKQKVGTALRSLHAELEFDLGVLASDSDSDRTEAPLAVVCRFTTDVSPLVLRDIHRLTWNYSRTPLLITVEPSRLRAWTCCEPPFNEEHSSDAEIKDVGLASGSIVGEVAMRLHWLNLISGHFLESYRGRFDRDQCADRLLLRNLTALRSQLVDSGLSNDICHDLLARLIFIQFLSDRKDSAGAAALTPKRFETLRDLGVLSSSYPSLPALLRHHADAYSFFKWLNDRFNGDLFPGSGRSADEREEAWTTEQRDVTAGHLALLADFVEGRIDLGSRQELLWRDYSFDVIPLEFISSIYEEFVSHRTTRSAGTVYTPAHVVDLLLDRALPWDSTNWNVRVLDPACGSGIFLVKAYQRIIHRWKNAHPGEEPRPSDLRRILERNLFGCDIDDHAVRVASFSLYLEMCDNIDPKHYWTNVRFPALRGVTLLAQDFFLMHRYGCAEAEKYDLIVGNVPWGRGTAKGASLTHLRSAGWPVSYGSLGPLFIPQSVKLLRENGVISLIQETGLLTKVGGPAAEIRRKLFQSFAVDEVINMSALRFGLFAAALSPACILTLRASRPSGVPIRYICPKASDLVDDNYRIVVDSYDVNDVDSEDAASDPTVWVTLMWGGPRTMALVRRLRQLPDLTQAVASGRATARQGVKQGKGRQREAAHLVDMPMLGRAFPEGTFKFLDSSALPPRDRAGIHYKDSTDFAAFASPQLLVKRSWTVSQGRFSAAIVPFGRPPVMCSASYLVVHADQQLIEQLWALYNSSFAVFWLFTHSARFAWYRPEVNVESLMTLPIPPQRIQDVTSHEALDRAVGHAFSLREGEMALLADAVTAAAQFHAGGTEAPFNSARRRRGSHGPDPLESYAEIFAGVLNAIFGKAVAITVFDDSEDPLPYRVVAVHLVNTSTTQVRVQLVNSLTWYREVARLSETLSRGQSPRVARLYDTLPFGDEYAPSVIMLKPDRERYWTRSMAMQDADDVTSDMLVWWHHGGSDANANTPDSF